MSAFQSARHKFGRKETKSYPSDFEEEEKLLFSDHQGYKNVDEASLRHDLLKSEHYRVKRRFSYVLWLTLFNLALFCATVVINSKTILQQWEDETSACVRATSSYSPFLESRPVEFHRERINGTIWPSKSPSWSRKEIHDPETEAMWAFFEDITRFPISRADVLALGKDPETVTKFPDEIFGLGEEAYMASLDVQHKLHCLNNLRTMAFATYGPNPSNKKQHGQLWWHHLRHCLDIVIEDMICHADSDIVTYRWMDTEPWPFPDFSIDRKCRSLDDLFRWRDEKMVDANLMDNMTRPPEVIPVPHEPGYYAAYGFYYSDLYPNGEGYPEELPSTDWFGLPPTPDQGFDETSTKDSNKPDDSFK